MEVWIVSLEWNHPPSEVTGDTGIVDVFVGSGAEQAARKRQRQEQESFDEHEQVYEYSMAPGRYCIACGELKAVCLGQGCPNIDPESAEEFCDHCGAELNRFNSCDNDHDEWSIDVHCHKFEATEVNK